MSQGFAGSRSDSSKKHTSPPRVQLYLAEHRLSLTISLHKTKTGTGVGHWLGQSMSGWHIFSSCKWFLFIEERVHTEQGKTKRKKSAGSSHFNTVSHKKPSLSGGNSPSEGLLVSTGPWDKPSPSDTSMGTQHVPPLRRGWRMLWRNGTYCLASISNPVLIPDAKDWRWYLSGEVYFASLLVMAYAKYSITSPSYTTCWKVAARTQARHRALV